MLQTKKEDPAEKLGGEVPQFKSWLEATVEVWKPSVPITSNETFPSETRTNNNKKKTAGWLIPISILVRAWFLCHKDVLLVFG